MHNRYDPRKQRQTDMQVLSFYMKRHHELASLKHVTDQFLSMWQHERNILLQLQLKTNLILEQYVTIHELAIQTLNRYGENVTMRGIYVLGVLVLHLLLLNIIFFKHTWLKSFIIRLLWHKCLSKWIMEYYEKGCI